MNEISDTIFENFDLKKITTNIPILLKKDVPIMYKCKKTYHIFYHTFMNYYSIQIHKKQCYSLPYFYIIYPQL